MDSSKKKALINWVNALNNNAIERLEQLWDGSFLLEVTRRIDGEIEDHEDPKERLKLVLSYLRGCYSDQKPQISWSRIFFEQAEREIGKVCALLVCQSVECEKKGEFVQVILGLDEESQMNMKHIIEFILVESPATGLRPDFADVLDLPCHDEASSNGLDTSLFVGMKLTFANTPSPHTSDSVAVDLQQQQQQPLPPPFRLVTRCAATQQYYSNSPTKQFLNSPQVGTKIALRENKKQMEKLTRDLRTEMFLRQEREQELEENKKYLIEKDCKIDQLKSEVKGLQHLRFVEDDLKTSKLAVKEAQDEIAKFTMITKHNEALQIENSQLQKRLTEETYHHDQLRLECERNKQSILDIIKEKDELQSLKEERENALKDEIQQLEERICQQATEEVQRGESLGFILEKRVSDLESEKENLEKQRKEQYTALCEQKENEISTMKAAYENKLIKFRTTLAELASEKQCVENQLCEKEVVLNSKIVELQNHLAAEREQNQNKMSVMEASYERKLAEVRTQITGLQKDYDAETQNKRSLTKEFHCRLRDISQQQQQIMETTRQEKNKYEKDLAEKNKKIVEMEKTQKEHDLQECCLKEKIDKLSKQQENEINHLKLKYTKEIGQKDSEIVSLRMKYNERVKENDELKQTIEMAQSEMGRFNRYKAETDKKLQESDSRGDLYKTKLQKLVNQYTILQTKHESHCGETNSKLRRHEREKLDLSTQLQSLQNEHKMLKEMLKTLEVEITNVTHKFSEEQKTNDILKHRLRCLEVQFRHGDRELIKANEASSSHYLAENSDTSMLDDTLIRQDSLEPDDHTLCLSDLEISQMSRRSKPSNLETNQFSSRESLTSINSKRASTIFEITMTRKTSLEDDTISDKDESFEFGHHVIPTLKSSPSCTLDAVNKQTTGRAGFVLMGGCEDEPEHFDWNRVSEMQRRNTLCPPHLRTAYPIETQHATPTKVEENALKNKTDQEKVRKRKAVVSDDKNHGARRRLRSSVSQRPNKTRRVTPRKSTSAQKETVRINKECTAFDVGFTPLKDKQNRKSLRVAKNDNRKETCESTAFSIGFTPIKKRKAKLTKQKKETDI
ncbi:uncharacterized protein LOC100370042 [Saccoglossus kowalevskii]